MWTWDLIDMEVRNGMGGGLGKNGGDAKCPLVLCRGFQRSEVTRSLWVGLAVSLLPIIACAKSAF